ncbi:hypothetical protein D1AOALGA4SA_8430 [Olavius algarvensis Delta 1 endosymbiont]|nr:hypothetical protein D1AOALGA4SA_8430 [Olavius algarvensis Delta 1 endosymbiont]
MSLVSKIFFILFMLSVIPASILVFVFKKKNFSVPEIFWRGSSINRDLEKYVQIKFVKPIRLLFYIGLGSFLICIAFLLLNLFTKI